MSRIEGENDVSQSLPIEQIQQYQEEQARLDELARSQTTQPHVQTEARTAEVSGTERTTESVQTANRQQDRGEDWGRFAAKGNERELPQSVEDKANQAKTDVKSEEQQRISVQDLQNQMQLQSGRFRG